MNCLKWLLLLWLIFFPVCPLPAWATTANFSAPGGEEGQELDMERVEGFISRLDSEIQASIPEMSFKDLLIKLARGDVQWKPADIFHSLLTYFFKEVVANSALLGKLIILAIICAVLQNLTNAFERGTTGQLSYMVVYLVLVPSRSALSPWR